MDSELIELIQQELEKSDLHADEKAEMKEALAVLPTYGLRAVYEALQLGPIHARMFFESYKKKKDIFAHKDMKAWRKLIGEETKQIMALL